MDIVIALDTYDDIFSDFDIRSYRERAFSRDFLDELHIRLRRAGDGAEHRIIMLMPARDRNERDERLIVERMQAFFAERRGIYARKDRRAKLRALLFVTTGVAFSFAANYLVGRLSSLPLIKDFLLIPAWFFVWSGLEMLLKNRDEMLDKSRYYAALSGAEASFRDREEY